MKDKKNRKIRENMMFLSGIEKMDVNTLGCAQNLTLDFQATLLNDLKISATNS